ncbi:KinB-signaling pathway activation protein [Ornithinibacillus sp. 4-3]|uniref:KinB-signaling pathway activation protein n=1 Tax=Ornithinibacillus sp. 4-3 TaxID=3231488 RepID=A0AB39HRR1_9BACI
MNSRKLVGFFFKTLFLGAIICLVASFFIKSDVYLDNIKAGEWFGLVGLFAWYMVYGMLYSIISQAGFFAYLFINRFGLGLFRSFWPTVQGLLIAFVIFDLVYFPYKATEGIALYWFIAMALAIFAYGWIIAKIKAKETHARAFMPALFLMVVMTAIEWVPGLRSEGIDITALMIITLLACNTYQLLMLHRLSPPGQTQASQKSAGNQKNPAQNQKLNPKKA